MSIFFYLAILVILVGIVGCVVPIIPGIPIIFAAVFFYGWYESFIHINASYLVVIGLLTAFSLVSDYIIIAKTQKLVGASKASSIGAIAGAILGIFIFPPLGIIIFCFLGAFLVELVLAKDLVKASKAALGTILAFFTGSVIKVIIGIGILVSFVMKVL